MNRFHQSYKFQAYIIPPSTLIPGIQYDYEKSHLMFHKLHVQPVSVLSSKDHIHQIDHHLVYPETIERTRDAIFSDVGSFIDLTAASTLSAIEIIATSFVCGLGPR